MNDKRADRRNNRQRNVTRMEPLSIAVTDGLKNVLDVVWYILVKNSVNTCSNWLYNLLLHRSNNYLLTVQYINIFCFINLMIMKNAKQDNYIIVEIIFTFFFINLNNFLIIIIIRFYNCCVFNIIKRFFSLFLFVWPI